MRDRMGTPTQYMICWFDMIGLNFKLARRASEAALREYCDKNYHQLLPIIAEKVHQENIQQEILKAVKACLNFEEASQHSESGTPSRRRFLRKRLGSRRIRNTFGRPKQRRDRSKSPRKRVPKRKTVFKRLQNGVFHRLGDKGKSMQRDGESTKEFVRRYKLECRDVKGAPECMKISRFMHGITNPELIKRLHDKIPKFVDEMMRVNTTFLRGEVAASNHERKKSFLSWKQQETRSKQNFKKEGFRNQQRSERKQDRFTLLTKTSKEIMALDKGKFKPPPPMTTPVEKRNASKFCEFHREVGHTTDECMHLKRQIEKMHKAGKLSHLIKELKQSNGKDQAKAAKKGETIKKDKLLAIIMVQPWRRVAKQRITQTFSPESVISFMPLGEEDGTEGPMIIEAEMGGHFVHRMNHRKARGKEDPGSPIYSSRNAKIPSDERNSHITEQQDYPAIVYNGLRTSSTLTEEGQTELYGLLRRNLDVFSWKLADMTGKRGQAPERNKAIHEEVEKLVNAGIMKEVHYHSWLSNPVMVKKHDDSWRMCVDFKDLNKACLKDGYPLPEIDWKVCSDKVEAVLSLPSLKCLKDVQRLNGKLASLNRFLSKSAEKSLSFFKTLKKCTKKSDFKWTTEAKTAFKQMKKLIAKL
ncbi:hypothetical protein Tco_1400480 [Tanacetum coccineum]